MKKKISFETFYDASGEEKQFIVSDTNYSHAGFFVLMKKQLVKVLEHTNNSYCLVIAYCLKLMNSDNLVVAKVSKIAKDLELSTRTVQTILSNLIDASFISRVEDCVLMVNPGIIMRGTKQRKNILVQQYINARKNTYKKYPVPEETSRRESATKNTSDDAVASSDVEVTAAKQSFVLDINNHIDRVVSPVSSDRPKNACKGVKLRLKKKKVKYIDHEKKTVKRAYVNKYTPLSYKVID